MKITELRTKIKNAERRAINASQDVREQVLITVKDICKTNDNVFLMGNNEVLHVSKDSKSKETFINI